MSSVQDNLIMATGSKIEKRRHQQSFHAQVAHSTAPSLIIDGACARVILNPERSVQPAAALQQSQAGSARQGKERRRGTPGHVPGPLRTGHGLCCEMMGRDWVAATRVHLLVQPGVPPLLFVSEGRWGPVVGHLPQGWECEDWEGGTPVAVGRRFSALYRSPAWST